MTQPNQSELDRKIDEILDRYLDSQWNGNMRNEILDWHNKQIEEVLDRLARQGTAGIGLMGDTYIPLSALQAERAKLKEVK